MAYIGCEAHNCCGPLSFKGSTEEAEIIKQSEKQKQVFY